MAPVVIYQKGAGVVEYTNGKELTASLALGLHNQKLKELYADLSSQKDMHVVFGESTIDGGKEGSLGLMEAALEYSIGYGKEQKASVVANIISYDEGITILTETFKETGETIVKRICAVIHAKIGAAGSIDKNITIQSVSVIMHERDQRIEHVFDRDII